MEAKVIETTGEALKVLNNLKKYFQNNHDAKEKFLVIDEETFNNIKVLIDISINTKNKI